MAEREGFEPSEELSPSTDFESAAFDHSATSPQSTFPFCAFRKKKSMKNFFAGSSFIPYINMLKCVRMIIRKNA